ncbi:MAG: trigger factor [Arenicellales bacterium WSBS_2016_MAG_OTU3]
MQVSVENTGSIGRKMTISLPASDIEDKIKQRLANLSKTVKLPGFRPGKVPKSVVEGRFGDQVMQEVAGEMIESSFRDALMKEEILPAGGPSIEPKAITRGQDLEYVASFDVYPEIPKTSISSTTIEKPIVEVTDADIEQTLENMRQRQVEYKATEEPAKTDDRVTMDFVGTIEGEIFQGSDAKDFQLVLGLGNLLPDFEDGLQGKKKDEEFTLGVTFPETYPAEEVAGKSAEFKINVKQVEQPELPTIDADFAKAMGVEDGDLDRLRGEVRQNLTRELQDRVRSHTRNEVMQALLIDNDFELPSQLVEEEISRMVQSMQAELKRQGLGDKMPEIDRSRHEEEARKRVSLGLIMQDIMKKNKMTADEARVRTRVENIAQSYEQPDQFVQWYMDDKDRLTQLQSMILEEQIVEKLLEDATVTDKSMSFQEFMNPKPIAEEIDA